MTETQKLFLKNLEITVQMTKKDGGLSEKDCILIVRLLSKRMYNEYQGSENQYELDTQALKLEYEESKKK